MLNILKKFIAILIVGLLIFPFELNQTEAASTTIAKTVEYFIGQESAVKGSGEYVNFPLFTINIPESSLAIKSAIIEVSGVSYNDIGNQTITIDLERNNDAAGAVPAYAIDHALAVAVKPKSFKLQYDALNDALKSGAGPMSDIIASGMPYAYTLYVKNTVSAGLVSFSIASAKLILTYNSSSSGSDFLKKTNFFISQEKNLTPSNSEIKRDFSIIISESIPEARSVFVEVSGIAKGSGTNNTIQLSVVKEGSPIYNTYDVDLSLLPANSKFIARYDMTALIDPVDFPVGNYSLYVKNSFDTYLLGAKLIITYKYSVNTGNLPARGELISSTFDTGVAKGAAYNSLMWKGDLKGGFVGQVGLQLAASDCLNGKTNFPDCNDAGVWSFEGPECNSGTNYIPAANTPVSVEIACATSHNNKRYFRYKVIICSNVNCATKGSITPQVDEVVVNWGP